MYSRQLKEQAKVTVGVLTGASTPAERDKTLEEFRTGKIKVMMATDVLCRGINIPSINFVVHYDLPVQGDKIDKTTYIHRAGRCARFTNKGVSLAFEVENYPVTTQVLDKLEGNLQAEADLQGEPAAGPIIQQVAEAIDVFLGRQLQRFQKVEVRR